MSIPTPATVRRALCPGSFDPVTNGHLDIVGRAAQLYDEVIVAVFVNESKSSVFTVDERRAMLEEATASYGNVRIDSFHGLIVDYCKAHDIPVIVKGLRAVSAFDQELQMAQMNQRMSGIDTFFLSTSPQHSFLSSSLVREVARYGGDVSGMVPKNVNDRLVETFRTQEE